MRLAAATGIIVAVATFVVDQVTKFWAAGVFEAAGQRVIEVLPFFNLSLAWNRGVSFGLFAADSPAGRWGLIAFAGVASIVIAVMMLRSTTVWATVGFGMILGGALGNMVDRLRYGAVFDFIDVHAMGWHFWTFNVADAGISVGVVCLLIDAFFGDMKGEKTG